MSLHATHDRPVEPAACLTTLGAVTLRDGAGAEIAVQPKRLALLVYLAASSRGGPHRRDSLTGLFWPDRDGEKARGNLRQALRGLRQVLPSGALLTTGDEVSLEPGLVACDAVLFEQAVREGDPERAVAVYPAPFLEGFFVSDAAEFEEWVEQRRAELARSHEASVRDLAARAAREGDSAAAVEWNRRLVELDPYSTRVALGFMEALVASGDRAGALHHAKNHAAWLRAEFGAEPSPDVQALAQRLRSEPSPLVRPAKAATDEPSAFAGRYTIVREVGRGATSIVYLADDPKNERQVALKLLRPELSLRLAAESFVDEIRLTANLHSPHILPLLDSGVTDEFLYYVMPYIDGESLRQRLRRDGKMSVDEALPIARDVADALAYAHSKGIVHRDVKPDNILLSDGHAQVADFGIARAISAAGDDRLSRSANPVGTPNYMSPEQAAGATDVDERSDVFSLGCVLFEMLTGRHASRVAEAETVPRSVRLAAPNAPDELCDLVGRCLQSDRELRPTDARHALETLEGARANLVPLSIGRVVRHPVTVSVAVAAAAVIAVVTGSWVAERDRHRWVRNTAVPGIEALFSELALDSAYRLWVKANEILPDDPQVRRWGVDVTRTYEVVSDPPGAEVFVRGYPSTSDWLHLGRTPIAAARSMAGPLRFRLTMAGYDTLEAYRQTVGPRFTFELARSDISPEAMVWAPPSRQRVRGDVVDFSGFWLDRYEVTNRDYGEFVQGGGYTDTTLWTEPLVDGGRVVPWGDAVARMRDVTGELGPATWNRGWYAPDRADHPVGGVSWYEANAYCAFVGKSLPTLVHWRMVARPNQTFNAIAPASNMGGTGTLPVGASRSVTFGGAEDMAGNVREWIYNANVTPDSRYVFGGGWDDPLYLFWHAEAASPWDRDPRHGFRCARYEEPLPAGAESAIVPSGRDLAAEPVWSNDLFEAYSALYSYQASPLNAAVEAVLDTSARYVEEIIGFDAAYGGERVVAHLFLPKNAERPYQVVVYYPEATAYRYDWEHPARMIFLDYVIDSGRAVMYPFLKGTYSRREHNLRATELRIRDYQDIARSIDYLFAREDIDSTRIAYYGNSFGGMRGPLITALEKRFSASILLAGGSGGSPSPERDPYHFAPWSTVPTIMIHGRWDAARLVDTQVEPVFRRLGTDEAQKDLHLVDSGHIIPLAQLAPPVLRWLDTYLGSVRFRELVR